MQYLIFTEIVVIKIYQKVFSFEHGIPHKLFPHIRICLFNPTCSDYAIEALKVHGFIKGNVLTAKRIVKCGPWSWNMDSSDPVPRKS